MNDENLGRSMVFHSLIPLIDFQAIFGIDDRESGKDREHLETAISENVQLLWNHIGEGLFKG
jgi:hypothetical protein